MDIALAISIISLLIAVGSASYARSSANAAKQSNDIEPTIAASTVISDDAVIVLPFTTAVAVMVSVPEQPFAS